MSKVGIVGLAVFSVMIALGLCYGIPSFFRYQTLAGERNEITVNEIRIQQQEQLIQVERQKAQIRVEEAKGISESQKIIDSSLTVNYLQYLAIKAQEHMAGSPNHTQIYIPVGNNGIPIVKNLDPKE